jgi:hypothetical protein
MKLTATSQFETRLIDGTKSYDDLRSFIEYQLAFNQNVERILRQQITLADNIACRFVTGPFTSNQEFTFDETRAIKGITCMSSLQSPVTSLKWVVKDNGSVGVTLTFATTVTQEATLTIYY